MTPAAKWFRPSSIFIVLWMVLGVAMFAMDLLTTPEQAAALPEAQRLLRDERPFWIMIVFGVATGAGLLGAIALLLRKAMAVTLLTLSLAAVTLQFGYTILAMEAIERIGAAQALGVPGFIFLMGAISLWVAIKGANETWLE
jgi:uncharacterized membrane protein